MHEPHKGVFCKTKPTEKNLVSFRWVILFSDMQTVIYIVSKSTQSFSLKKQVVQKTEIVIQSNPLIQSSSVNESSFVMHSSKKSCLPCDEILTDTLNSS